MRTPYVSGLVHSGPSPRGFGSGAWAQVAADSAVEVTWRTRGAEVAATSMARWRRRRACDSDSE